MATTPLPDDCELGIPEVDEQHRNLFSQVAELQAACDAGAGNTDVRSLVEAFDGQVRAHFAYEEVLQKKYRYPARDVHRILHEDFLARLDELRLTLAEGCAAAAILAAELPSLAASLAHHVRKDDRDSANFIRRRMEQQPRA